MDELVTRLTNAAGLDRDTATAAVKTILVFLDKEAPSDAVSELVDALPGSRPVLEQGKAEAADQPALGGFGAMAAYHALTAVGLTGGQVQIVTKELLAHSRQSVGEETTGRIVGAVPGLEAFV
jgi:hypothetical protein